LWTTFEKNKKPKYVIELSVIIIWEDKRPRLSRQTGFQPVSLPAIRFDISNIGKTGVLACLGKRASSLFLHLPFVLKSQTTEPCMTVTAGLYRTERSRSPTVMSCVHWPPSPDLSVLIS